MKNNRNIKILIATGIYPPDVGGPAQYAKNLAEEFGRQGNSVKILSYQTEKKLPPILRHFFYFFKVLFNLPGSGLVVALDTFSVGLPAVAAARIMGKKIIVRVGGDFLWESYTERTGDLITLSEFYGIRPALSDKEKIILFMTQFVLKKCSVLVFSTDWQKNIWEKAYRISPEKCRVIENFYGDKMPDFKPKEKNFIWAGRPIKLKNIGALKEAFDEAAKEDNGLILEIFTDLPHQSLLEKLKACYAVILPSLSEVSPNFILDAISVSKPFILTKETGFYEKLKNTGIFIDPFDKKDIKNKILFLADRNNYQEYKKRIADFNFLHSWQEIAEDFLSVYEELGASLEFSGEKKADFAPGENKKNSNRMKILSIGSDRNLFKENSAVRQRIIEYGSLADELHVIVFSKNEFLQRQISRNIYLYSTGSLSRWLYPFDAARLGNIIVGGEDNWLVTVQDPFEAALAGYLIKRKSRAKLYIQIHGDFLSPYFWQESFLNKIRVWLAKFLLPKAEGIRVVSSRIRESLKDIKIKNEPIILPIFVDAEKIKKSPVKTDLRQKYPQFDFVILMASRLVKVKNIDLAIEAMSAIISSFPKTGLIIVGEGREKETLDTKVKSLILSDNIIFEPWSDDLVSYYKTADLFLLTSNHEGYGLTAAEAMAAGCPLIITDVGCAGELIKNEYNGLVINIGDKKALARAIARVIKDPPLRQILKNNALESVKRLMTKEEYLKQYKQSWQI